MTWSRRPKAVIDTNVFVSGILFGGNPELVLKAVKDHELELVVSPKIEAEVLIKLRIFQAPVVKIEEWKRNFENKSIMVKPVKQPRLSRDAEDDVFLAVATEAKADFIVTGDKDLLVLHPFGKIAIVTPKVMVEILEN